MPKKFSVTWTAPANDGGAAITDYDIGYTPAGGSETVEAHGGTTPPHEILNLTDGTTYSVRVRAINSQGAGAWSSAVSQVAAVPADAPTGLALTAQTEALDLAWTAPAYTGGAAITGYSVRYTPAGGSASTVATGSTGTTYTLSGLTGGTAYSVEVAAITAAGTGAYSSAATDTPAAVVASTELLLSFNNNLNDTSGNNHTVSSSSSATFTSSSPRFGSHARTYVSNAYDPDTVSPTVFTDAAPADYTVEFWMRVGSGGITNLYNPGFWGVLDIFGSTYDSAGIYADAYASTPYSLAFYWYQANDNVNTGSGTITSTTAFPEDNDWHHIAVVREGATYSLYLDGTRIATNTNANNTLPWGTTDVEMYIGLENYMMGYEGFDGDMDEFRLSSSAVYSGASFTVPTSPLS